MIDDLLGDRDRLALALVERGDQAVAARERALRVLVEVGAERANASRSRNCDSSPFIRPATFFIGAIWALPPTRDTEMPTLIAGRTPEKKSFGSRKICPSVIEITFVGM